MADAEDLEHNLAVVRRVCLEWDTLSRADWHQLLTPDCDYRNIPIEGDRHIGPNEVHDVIAPFGARWEIEATIVTIAAMGELVLTERIDHLWNDQGGRHSAHIMGTFEVQDGLIVRYADYFDASQFNPQAFLEEAG